jgi:hypothetical protein
MKRISDGKIGRAVECAAGKGWLAEGLCIFDIRLMKGSFGFGLSRATTQ